LARLLGIDATRFVCCGGQPLAITSGANTGRASRPKAALPMAASSKDERLAALQASLGTHATAIRTRRGQNVALSVDGADLLFIVRAGALTLNITMPGASRQIAAVLFPGDVLSSGFVPQQAEGAFVPVTAGELLRLRWSAFADLMAKDPSIAS